MKQSVVECFAVSETSWEINHKVIAYVSTVELARTLVNESPSYRSFTEYKKIVTIFDTYEEVCESRIQTLRDSALKKLSKEERAALGLADA